MDKSSLFITKIKLNDENINKNEYPYNIEVLKNFKELDIDENCSFRYIMLLATVKLYSFEPDCVVNVTVEFPIPFKGWASSAFWILRLISPEATGDICAFKI